MKKVFWLLVILLVSEKSFCQVFEPEVFSFDEVKPNGKIKTEYIFKYQLIGDDDSLELLYKRVIEYDDKKNIIKFYNYSSRNQLIINSSYDKIYKYDESGRKIEERFHQWTGIEKDSIIEISKYDSEGNIIEKYKFFSEFLYIKTA